MSRNDIHHLAAAYALDAVDDHERADFETHYVACDVCTLDVREFQATLAVLASSLSIPTSAQLKERVMASIAKTRQFSPRVPERVADLAHRRELRRRRMTTGLLAAAAAFVLVVAGVLAGRNLGNGSSYASAAQKVFNRADTHVVAVPAADASASGQVRVAWSASAGRAVVLADGLPDPGAGNRYELWLIDGSGAHAMRMLDDAHGGTVRRVLEVDGTPTQWGVTIERSSGADTPTAPILFAGTA